MLILRISYTIILSTEFHTGIPLESDCPIHLCVNVLAGAFVYNQCKRQLFNSHLVGCVKFSVFLIKLVFNVLFTPQWFHQGAKQMVL